MISWDEDLRRDRERGEPVDESPELRLIAVWVLPVGRVSAVDDHIDPVRNDQLTVVHVSVRDVPGLHVTRSYT